MVISENVYFKILNKKNIDKNMYSLTTHSWDQDGHKEGRKQGRKERSSWNCEQKHSFLLGAAKKKKKKSGY